MAVTTSSGNGFALYNGVKLPKLPEYDEGVYPYAYIKADFSHHSVQATELFVCKSNLIYNGSNVTSNSRLYVCKWVLTNGEWVFDYEDSIIGGANYSPAFWTNHDILNTADSTVYLAASDPIPLDGMNVIEWDGDTTGLESISIGCKVSDEVIDKETAQKGIVVMSDNTISDTGMHFELSGDVFALETGAVCIVYKDGVTVDGETVEHKGVYFLYGALYTKLFAYPASGESEPTYDRTAFLSGLAMGLSGKGNPTFEGSGKMLYNGVELPALPEWDKIKYPYVCMVRYFEDTTVGYSTQVFMSAEPPIYDYAAFQRTAKIPTPYLTCSNDRDYVTPTAWTNLTESTSGDFIVSTMYDIAWTNVDILKDDGTVYVAASDPVPVEDVFSKGYHVGAELRKKRVLPVAYLYNGVELPKLPKTDLPYAVLTHHEAYHSESYGVVIDEPERYQLSILAEPFYAETLTNGTTIVRSNPLVKYQRWKSYAPDFSKWELDGEGNRWVVSYKDVVWTNHNVFFGELADTVEENVVYTDELYMAKSPAPIPVYE